MAHTADDQAITPGEERARRGFRIRWRYRFLLLIMALVAGALAFIWLSRERIAGNIIAAELEKYDLPATYDIVSIGPERQVLENIVIGDPARPDATVGRAIVPIRWRFGTPRVGQVTLIRPRIYGSYTGGQLSFGTLDRVLFRDTGDPPSLPAIDIVLVDARALLETDFGPVGMKAQGEGWLDGGFKGLLAVNAPEVAGVGCQAQGVTAYGSVAVEYGEPKFAGPLRLGSLRCADRDLALETVSFLATAQADKGLAAFEGEGTLEAGPSTLAGTSLQALTGRLRASWREGGLNAAYDLAGTGLASGPVRLARIEADGAIRARSGFERIEIETDLAGTGIRPGNALDSALGDLVRSSDGTLVAPLLERVRRVLRTEAPGSRFAARATLRKTGDVMTAVVPQARLVGGSGANLFALSRGQFSTAGDGAPRLAGNFGTGGDLPTITGRMERRPNGNLALRMRMAEYAVGANRLAIPEMVLSQSPGGAIGFAGRILADGALPMNGAARGLRIPVNGTWSPSAGLALWRECTPIAFDRLSGFNLVLERRGLTLCPQSGGAIVRYGPGGIRVAAGIPSLNVAGRLGSSPMRLNARAVGLAWPGRLVASDVDLVLGSPGAEARFAVDRLDGTLGERIGGTFAGTEARLANVPIDVLDANGNWRFANDSLFLSNAALSIADRQDQPRFKPMVANDAELALIDNIITAQGVLREPRSDRAVTAVDIRHDLGSGVGRADLTVEGLLFDEALQPADLSRLALGVIANTRGIVTGTGRIDWNQSGVTSSGAFTTEDLDFAAAFGPVKGASGTVVFTDLLGLTTAPDQVLQIASVNPGIEVTGGEVRFQLKGGQLLSVQGGRWPFMGGTLVLRGIDLNFGASEARRYVFEIVGLEAAEFVERMDIPNLSATGTFDGVVPIVFDKGGNGEIEEGELNSRSPGGTIAYLGELSREDLSPIANFAFDALKSLKYNHMRVVMDGPLTGEIVTRVRFDGVQQGAGATRNFITRRLAKLPLQFRINIRAQFYKLIGSMKSLYDPASVRDPRDLGLLSDDGTRFLRREITDEEVEPEIDPTDLIPDDEQPIQQ